MLGPRSAAGGEGAHPTSPMISSFLHNFSSFHNHLWDLRQRASWLQRAQRTHTRTKQVRESEAWAEEWSSSLRCYEVLQLPSSGYTWASGQCHVPPPHGNSRLWYLLSDIWLCDKWWQWCWWWGWVRRGWSCSSGFTRARWAMASLMARAGEQYNQYELIVVSINIGIAYMPIGSISLMARAGEQSNNQ